MQPAIDRACLYRRASRKMALKSSDVARQEPTDPTILAGTLGMSPQRLRALIRQNKLVPQHVKGTRYKLTPADVERISRHVAVTRASRKKKR